MPSDTESFVLIVEDIDWSDRWKNWIVYNIPNYVTSFTEGILVLPKGCKVLHNDHKHQRYDGPTILENERRFHHHYMFRLVALNISTLDLSRDELHTPSYDDLLAAMYPHIIKETTLMGTYDGIHHD